MGVCVCATMVGLSNNPKHLIYSTLAVNNFSPTFFLAFWSSFFHHLKRQCALSWFKSLAGKRKKRDEKNIFFFAHSIQWVRRINFLIYKNFYSHLDVCFVHTRKWKSPLLFIKSFSWKMKSFFFQSRQNLYRTMWNYEERGNGIKDDAKREREASKKENLINFKNFYRKTVHVISLKFEREREREMSKGGNSSDSKKRVIALQQLRGFSSLLSIITGRRSWGEGVVEASIFNWS